MLRLIFGVVFGYVAMVVTVMITFSLAYLALGPEGSFQPGNYEVSGAWIILSFLLGFLGAVVGGLTAKLLGSRTMAPLILAVLVLVLGIVMALPTLSQPADLGVRSGAIDSFDAMQQARQPVWVAFLNPFVGAVGILIGSTLWKRGS